MSEIRQMLGEMLLARGLISPGDLERGLSEQQNLGWRLGSTLVSMGLAPLADVAVALGAQLGVPVATVADFANVGQQALAAMSPTICSRYHAFPLSLTERVLTVAMVEPNRLDLVDELAFSLGYAIRPAVAPEFQIHYHMAKRYGLLLERAQQHGPPGGAGPYQHQPPPGTTGPYPAQPPPPVLSGPYPAQPPPPVLSGPYPAQPASPPARARALSFQVNDAVLRERIRTLPRMVLDILPLIRQGLPLTEIFGRMDLSPERGMAVVKKLLTLGILR